MPDIRKVCKSVILLISPVYRLSGKDHKIFMYLFFFSKDIKVYEKDASM